MQWPSLAVKTWCCCAQANENENIQVVRAQPALEGGLVEDCSRLALERGSGRPATNGTSRAPKDQASPSTPRGARAAGAEKERVERPEYIFENGDKYSGQWLGDSRDGHGVLVYENGARYDGQWVADKVEGYGVYIGDHTYTGQWLRDEFHGEGELLWDNGDTYKGEWLAAKMHGRGVYRWTDGRSYEGEYRWNLREGTGVMRWPDGRAYNGPWRLDRQHGEAEMTGTSGKVMRGRWAEGKWQAWITPELVKAESPRHPGKTVFPKAAAGA